MEVGVVSQPREFETATLGGGCFWCLEAAFELLDGVEHVVSGYAGGHVEDPTYRQVCSGRTGHAEVVQVRYDPAVIGYEDLLRVFFTIHDPTTPNRQGADIGPQYRSIILYSDDDQRAAARKVIAELSAAGVFGAPIVTEVAPLDAFYPAEAGHQRYYRRNAGQPYCQAVIRPKIAKLRRAFADKLRE